MSIAGRSYKELQQEVLEFQFNELKYRPLVKRWLNDGVRKMILQTEFRTQEEEESFTTAAGVSTLELPANFSRFIDFYDSENNRLLIPLEKQDFDQAPESSGQPVAYIFQGKDLILYPTPDGAYPLHLRYWRLPQDMVNDSDEPELPPQYHDVPPFYALSKAFAREDDIQMSQFWKGEWEAALMKMRGEVQSDMYDGPTQVAGTYGDPHAARGLNAWW